MIQGVLMWSNPSPFANSNISSKESAYDIKCFLVGVNNTYDRLKDGTPARSYSANNSQMAFSID